MLLTQDILENDEIKLDWMFKSSLISDLCNVSTQNKLKTFRAIFYSSSQLIIFVNE